VWEVNLKVRQAKGEMVYLCLYFQAGYFIFYSVKNKLEII